MRSKPVGRPSMSNWSSALALAIALTASPAVATESASLAGAWQIRATYEAIGCVITGEAVLTPRNRADIYDVRMTTIETCDYDEGPNAPVDQACTATRRAEHVSVDCRVIRVDPGRGYLPDDFELLVIDDASMIGRLTANWNAPAIWRRANAVPVS